MKKILLAFSLLLVASPFVRGQSVISPDQLPLFGGTPGSNDLIMITVLNTNTGKYKTYTQKYSSFTGGLSLNITNVGTNTPLLAGTNVYVTVVGGSNQVNAATQTNSSFYTTANIAGVTNQLANTNQLVKISSPLRIGVPVVFDSNTNIAFVSTNGLTGTNVLLLTDTGVSFGPAPAVIATVTEATLYPIRNAKRDIKPQVGYNGWPALGVANARETNVVNSILTLSNMNVLSIYPNFVVHIDEGATIYRTNGGHLYWNNFTGGSLSNVTRIAHLSGFPLIPYLEPNATNQDGITLGSGGTNIEFDAIDLANVGNGGMDGIKMDMSMAGGDANAVGYLNRSHAAFLGVTNKQYYYLSYVMQLTNLPILTQLYANNALLMGDWGAEVVSAPYGYWPLIANHLRTNFCPSIGIEGVSIGWSMALQVPDQNNKLFGRGLILTMAMQNMPLLFTHCQSNFNGTFSTGESYFECVTNPNIARIQQDKEFAPKKYQETTNSVVIFKQLINGNYALEFLNLRTNVSQTLGVDLIKDFGLPPANYTFTPVFPGTTFVNTTNCITNNLAALEAAAWIISPYALASVALSTPMFTFSNIDHSLPLTSGRDGSGAPTTLVDGSTAFASYFAPLFCVSNSSATGTRSIVDVPYDYITGTNFVISYYIYCPATNYFAPYQAVMYKDLFSSTVGNAQINSTMIAFTNGMNVLYFTNKISSTVNSHVSAIAGLGFGASQPLTNAYFIDMKIRFY